MTEITWQAQCMALLMGMNSGQEWQPAHTQVYDLVLRAIGPEYGPQAVEWAVLNEQWRPSPARLRQIAARLASPYPDAESAYAEILHKAQTVGLYGQAVPGRPNIHLAGSPAFSHPVVARVIAFCGGWESVCTGEANMAEGLKKQVRGAHESIAGQWEQAVSQQLALPEDRRDRRYFPRWTPYLLPAEWHEESALMALPEPEVDRDKRAPVPDELRPLIAGILNGKELK